MVAGGKAYLRGPVVAGFTVGTYPGFMVLGLGISMGMCFFFSACCLLLASLFRKKRVSPTFRGFLPEVGCNSISAIGEALLAQAAGSLRLRDWQAASRDV
ncbi:MAG TPA: hypothetical protein DEF45_11255 [Rhodopirellula sp.]|nr:hypothetical protein [Rhodopirellula sp.]